ncbi:hypothetical protein LOZ11_005100 [Ophidiomyces ophidiicola]|nr:hypothetical protein LOZ11_005100 [Ophidiomyces ophidiicola]
MTTMKKQPPVTAGGFLDHRLEALGATIEASSTESLISITDTATVEHEDEPPAYSEHNESSSLIQNHENSLHVLTGGSNAYEIPGGRVHTSKREGKTYTISLAPYLSSNAEVLYKFFKLQAALPPLVFVSVKGTHTLTRRNGDKQISSETVTDFDFLVDGSDTILPPAGRLNRAFQVLKVIQDNDGILAYRGGRFRSTNKSGLWKKGRNSLLEDGAQPGTGPTLEEWCQRFCNDKSSIKSFTLHRDIVNWNFELIRREIISIIRMTNYRGVISVSPFIRQSRVTIYSPSLLNRLRTNSFVWWVCVILQLWIITWPLLILLERRYEIVRVEHHVSRGSVYASPGGSEGGWVAMFSPAIKAAALGKRTGEVVTKADIPRGEEMLRDVQSQQLEQERQDRMIRGEATWADWVVGIVRGLSDMTRQWNTDRGWGGDE